MVPDTIPHDGIMYIYSLQPHISKLVGKLHLYLKLWWNNIPVSCFVKWHSSTGSLVESNWCWYVMVEADSHLKLLPPSTLDIYKVFEHIHMLFMGKVAAIHSYTHTTLLRFWHSVSLGESKWCHYIMVEADSHLKLLPTSILHIKKCLSSFICCPWAYGSSL